MCETFFISKEQSGFQRQEMLQNQLNTANVNLETMLFCCTTYEFGINQSIFKVVHEFIFTSGLF